MGARSIDPEHKSVNRKGGRLVFAAFAALVIAVLAVIVLGPTSGSSDGMSETTAKTYVSYEPLPVVTMTVTATVEASAPIVRSGDGYITWTPYSGVQTDGCANPIRIGTSGAVTVQVTGDVTYVDLQFPAELHGLVGLQAGDQYVVLPRFLLQADTATVVLGNQFDNRNVIYGCWEI